MAGNILHSIQGSEHAINQYMSNLKIHKVRPRMLFVPGDLFFFGFVFLLFFFLVETFQILIQCQLVDFEVKRVKKYFSRT